MKSENLRLQVASQCLGLAAEFAESMSVAEAAAELGITSEEYCEDSLTHYARLLSRRALVMADTLIQESQK